MAGASEDERDTGAAAEAILSEIATGEDIDYSGDGEGEGSGEMCDSSDDVDGWVDERENLTEEEREELRASVLPVKLILAKVRM